MPVAILPVGQDRFRIDSSIASGSNSNRFGLKFAIVAPQVRYHVPSSNDTAREDMRGDLKEQQSCKQNFSTIS